MADNLGSFEVKVSESGIEEVQAKFKKLGADLQDLERKENLLKTTSVNTSHAISDGVEKMSMTSARALGRFEIALDSLNHGFGRMERMLPSLAATLGASGPIVVGIAGIAAVAHAAYTHWDTLKESFGNTAPFEAVRGALIQMKEQMDKTVGESGGKEKGLFDRKVYDDINDLIHWWDKATDAAKRHADVVKEIEESTKRVMGVHDKAATERGGIFGEAVARAGGGESVVREMADRSMAGRTFKTPEEQKEARQQAVDAAIGVFGRGMAGENIPRQGLSGKMQGALTDVETEKDMPRMEKMLQERHETEKAMIKHVEEQNKLADKLNAAARENVVFMQEQAKHERMQELEDQKEAIQAQLHTDLEGLRGQRPGQIIQGAKASLDLYQTAGKSDADKAHKMREQAYQKLKSIDDTLKQERRLVIEH